MIDGNAERRVKAHRVLSLTMVLVALTGWSAFAYASHSADVAWHRLQEETARSKADQARLLHEHASALAMLHEQIVDLEQQLRLATARHEEASPDVSEAGRITVVQPSSSTTLKTHRSKSRP
jgi:hypothetical protein